MVDYLVSPVYQLALYIVIMLLFMTLGRLSAEYVMGGGVIVFLLWMAIAGSYGIRTSVSWHYYLQLVGAYVIGYLFLFGASWMSDRWGPSYNREGGIILMGPVTFGGMMTIAQLLLKAVWQGMISVGRYLG